VPGHAARFARSLQHIHLMAELDCAVGCGQAHGSCSDNDDTSQLILLQSWIALLSVREEVQRAKGEVFSSSTAQKNAHTAMAWAFCGNKG
jgi:hypothetical protein